MRFLLAFVVFLLFAFNANATAIQKENVKKDSIKKATLITDSSKITIKQIDEQAVNEYSKQRDFIYDDVTPAGLSWWDRFWMAVGRWFERLFSGGGKRLPNTGFLVFLKYASITVAVALIVFIVMKIFGLDLKFLTGKSKAVDIPYEESLENIHEIDFEDHLENAISNGNYRLAVRLLYLKTLKQLTDRNLINWQPEKTNQTYIAELTEEHKTDFADLTLRFEYIWYGDFYIDKESFEPINESFNQFNKQL
ncbi:DUF4129 domain-containing protein [Pedobacter namyangjuensis]|uniref:DUF4129 domain-containing protein n=1 Tax=Pedobacter namyangjuensis TaxID=600626 RepID=UPI000DE33612|nr:DUF4129 domain-containing protein [Pedobacter namyangjuensis]